MPQLPLECVEQVVQYVEDLNDLRQLLYVNKHLFFSAARCLWYDPLDTVTKTKAPNVSLLRLLRMIYAISPSEDENVTKVQQFFEWAASPSTTSESLRPEHTRFNYEYEFILREPFCRTTQPFVDYLSFISIFNVFTHPQFHEVVGEVICVPFGKWLHPLSPSAVDGEDPESDGDDEQHCEAIDLFERSLATATYGHRLPWIKCISVPFRHLGHYLDSQPLSSSSSATPHSLSASPQSKLANIRELVWDMAPRRMAFWGPIANYEDDIVDRILSRIEQCREQFKKFHTVELKETWAAMGFDDEMDITQSLHKHLPPLPSPKKLCRSNWDRVFAHWDETDLSQVQELKYTKADFDILEASDCVRDWPEVAPTEEIVDLPQGQLNQDLLDNQGLALRRLRSLRRLEFEAFESTPFAWAVQERLLKERGEAITLVGLRSITVHCELEHVERIINDAALGFGDTLQELDIRVYETDFVDENSRFPRTAWKIIRIGEGWRLPNLSRLILNVSMEGMLDIEPSFLRECVHLTHLEILDGNLEEELSEEDEDLMPTLHAPCMQYLRLIGTASWLFDPASLEHMCPNLEYLELRNQFCVFECGPDNTQWRWQEWTFPKLKHLWIEGTAVAGFPWCKIADYPQLQTVTFGAGPYTSKVAPWLGATVEEMIMEHDSDEGRNNSKNTGVPSSTVKRLNLRGPWLLSAPTLLAIVRDLCPLLKVLELRQCKGHDGETLYKVMKTHRNLVRVKSSRTIDFAYTHCGLEWTNRYREYYENYKGDGDGDDDSYHDVEEDKDFIPRILTFNDNNYLLPRHLCIAPFGKE
ncbi:hypothetical protein BGW42_005461 [Actinomortierella wolfii]|nr:hypothetical protein BGW42_005461 [Actinomortierella wolfii]